MFNIDEVELWCRVSSTESAITTRLHTIELGPLYFEILIQRLGPLSTLLACMQSVAPHSCATYMAVS